MATLPSETGLLLLARIDLPRPGEAELGALSFNEDGDKILVGGQAWYGRRPTNCDLRSEILLKGVVTNSPLKGNTPSIRVCVGCTFREEQPKLHKKQTGDNSLSHAPGGKFMLSNVR